MPDIGTKIKRRTYNFEIKKRYQYVSHYKIKNRPPIEKIKDTLKQIIQGKKDEKKEEQPIHGAPPGGFNFAVFGAFILIAVIILAVGWVFLTTQFTAGSGLGQKALDKPEIENTLVNGEIITAGLKNDQKNVAAVFIEYDTDNIDNYTIDITTYSQKIPSEVFILTGEKFEADSYPEFLRTLRYDLGKRKITLNDITIKQLETLPQGAVVIIPSGVIPKEILGMDSLITMDKLVERGVVVIYIGQPFTKILNGTLVVPTPKTVKDSLPIGFDESSSISSSEVHVYQPLYLVGSRSSWSTSVVYGSVSIAKKGNGAFVFFPQTLDGGWRGNYTSAAEDVEKIIYETAWAGESSPHKLYTFNNKTDYNGTEYFFSEPFTQANTTVKVHFTGYSKTTKYPVEETKYIRLNQKNDNKMFIELGGKVVPTNITDNLIRINAILKEPQAAQPSMSLVIEDNKGNNAQELPQGNVNTQSDKSFDIRVYTDKGEYIVKLVDDSGYIYTQTYMKVITPDIKYTGGTRQKPSIYLFVVTMDGLPLKLNQIDVKVDGGKYGTYVIKEKENFAVDVGSFTGNEQLPFGDHEFEFTSGKLTKKIKVTHYRAPSPLENPAVWIVFIFTGGIIAAGVVFARQDAIYYAIDVPDFPPVAKTKIAMTSNEILNIFDKVNENYRWQKTPLTPGEIKNGFRGMLHNGKAVYITDYNVEFVLHELERKELVKESIGYYGKTEWEGKKSIEYLALMRRLRDICVNNAVPFTQIDESKNADSVLTLMGQQMYIHFYERAAKPEDVLKKVMFTIKSGITIILFKNQFDRNYFKNVIDASPSVVPLILKMEVDGGSVIYQTTEELEKMLIEFKSM